MPFVKKRIILGCQDRRFAASGEGPVVDRNDVLTLLDSQGLSRISPIISELCCPSTRIRAREIDDEDLPLGASKFGGRPHLPAGYPWPERNGEPLTFLLQLNARHTPMEQATDSESDFGMFYFFYDDQEMPWGHDPANRGSGRVVCWTGNPNDLQVTEMPRPGGTEPRYYRCCAADCAQETTIPSLFSAFADMLELTEGEDDLYREVYQKVSGTVADQPVHRMLGHPDELQRDMRVGCQLGSEGITLDDTRNWADAELNKLYEKAGQWLLLLQLDSDNLPGMMWGDCGRLYFWAHYADLKAHKLDNIWTMLQCH